jgi:hypothetical protein
MFWDAGCSLIRSEGFSCSLDVLYGGPGISTVNCNFWFNFFFSSIFDHQNPGSGLVFRLKYWTRILINEFGSETLLLTLYTPYGDCCIMDQFSSFSSLDILFLNFLFYGKFTKKNTWFLAGRACLSHPRRMTFIGRKPTVPAAAVPAPAPSSRWVSVAAGWLRNADLPHFYADPPHF